MLKQKAKKDFGSLKSLFLIIIFCVFSQAGCASPAPEQRTSEVVEIPKLGSLIRPTARFQEKGPVHSFSISPNGRFFALAGAEGISLIDVRKNKNIFTLKPGPGDVLSLAFSPDSRLLASGGYKKVKLWRTNDGEPYAAFSGLTNYVTALSFSPNGHFLSATSSGEKAELKIWDLQEKRLKGKVSISNQYSEFVRDLTFNQDGSLIAFVGLDRKIRVWDVHGEYTSPKLVLFDAFTTPLVFSFSPDGETLAAGTSEGKIILFDLSRGEILKRIIGHPGPVLSMSFSPNGKKLISTGGDQTIRYWLVETGWEIEVNRVKDPAEKFLLTPGGRYMASLGGSAGNIYSLHGDTGIPPIIAIISPVNQGIVFEPKVRLRGKIVDDLGLERVIIKVNDNLLKERTGDWARDLKVEGEYNEREFFLDEMVGLRLGDNKISITATDVEGLSRTEDIWVSYLAEEEKVLAAVIGISKYLNIEGLKYADKDAIAFYNYLVIDNKIPKEQVTLLLNEEATLQRIKDVLGVDLKRKARKQDKVIIYYAGHGAPEPDRNNPDGDGFEKYLLPYDADPDRLYSTALPMGEISKIFSRFSSERVVFIQDTCYAGNSKVGGRTIQSGGFRAASISGGFLERVVRGKGRILLTASEANEISYEQDKLGHGVFTYYLLEAFSKGDIDGDGLITTGEAFRYVSKKVPDATGQNQHPVIQGELVREIVLGRVRNIN